METPSFYLIAIIVVVIFLIICLTGVGILMKYQNAGQAFPPAAQPCPDGWKVGIDGSCGQKIGSNTSLNTGRLYAVTGTDLNTNSPYSNSYVYPTTYVDTTRTLNDLDISINFTRRDATWTTCQQKTWANRYGIEWDGVSNYNGSC
jgi:hypothetical protein